MNNKEVCTWPRVCFGAWYNSR